MAKSTENDRAVPGHNSGQGFGKPAADHLKQLIERIERLEDEKSAIALDIKEIYAEAKAHGFEVKALRRIVALRKQDAAHVAELAAILKLYGDAVGLSNVFL